MRLGVAVATFAVIFPAELPDKTTLAALVLSSRYRARPVWAGAAAALGVQCLLAVTVGGLLALLPQRVVSSVAAVLFATGAVLAARGAGHEPDEEVGETAAATSARRIAGIAFGTILLAEFGDFTQLATASLAGRYDAPVEVFAGAWLALVAVSGLAAFAGRGLLRVVPLRLVRLVAAGLFAVVAVLSVVDVLRNPGA
jgi:putative Ca2+/H+ antiporter (TMEM165/GDT1 family)